MCGGSGTAPGVEGELVLIENGRGLSPTMDRIGICYAVVGADHYRMIFKKAKSGRGLPMPPIFCFFYLKRRNVNLERSFSWKPKSSNFRKKKTKSTDALARKQGVFKCMDCIALKAPPIFNAFFRRISTTQCRRWMKSRSTLYVRWSGTAPAWEAWIDFYWNDGKGACV